MTDRPPFSAVVFDFDGVILKSADVKTCALFEGIHREVDHD